MHIKFNPQLKNSLTNLWKVLTINYIAICVTVRFLATNAFFLRKVKIYLLTSCNTEERIAQNIYIHNSNRNYKNQLQEQY